MMSKFQERALRRLLKVGGKLQMPGFLSPVTIHVERASSNSLDKNVASASITTNGDFLVCRYSRWDDRELYPLIAERLDDLVVGEAA